MPDKISLQSDYSRLNASLTKLFDEAGVRRSFTVPYVHGQEMAEHIKAVGVASQTSGGLSRNIVTTSHHSDGRGWGSGDGHTVGHPSEKLRTTIIPKDDENAKAAIDAAQKYLNDVAKLIGDDNPAVQTAKGQLKLAQRTDGAGMTLLDLGVFLIQLVSAPTQAAAKAHNGNKKNGHQPQLSGPEQQAAPEGQEPQEAPQGEASGSEQPSEAPSAPEAPAAAPPQAQGQ